MDESVEANLFRLGVWVPGMDMDTHLARVEQRWRYLPDELPPGETLDIGQLAHDLSGLPVLTEKSSESEAGDFADRFVAITRVRSAGAGGAIEPADVPADSPAELDELDIDKLAEPT